MKKQTILALLISLLITPIFTSCTQNTYIKQETANQTHSLDINREEGRVRDKNNEKETLLRADPRFIAWLEQSSLIRRAPKLLSIVTGNSLAWRAPSLIPEKENILSHSPAWFYANPWKIQIKDTTHIAEFLASKTPEYLKHMGIYALFFTPSAPFSLNQELGYQYGQTNVDYYDTHDNVSLLQDTVIEEENNTFARSNMFLNIQEQAPEYAVVGFGIDEQVASQSDYQNLERTNMLIGGSILEPALGVGADFLLALRAVREYSGLFVMTELPENLWTHIPESEIEHTFAYTILDQSQKDVLAKHGLIPALFARDLIPSNFQKPESIVSSNAHFAVTDSIRGVDSVKRRWIYRFANDPKRPLLNLSDPNMNVHKLFNASIVEQIGLLHQPLISVSVGDLWGQEATYLTQENSFLVEKMIKEKDIKKLNSYVQQFAEPALFTLAMWNKIIHNYGAWSLIDDAFPLEFIPLLLEEKADFVADTVFMPALEKSFIASHVLALKEATQRAIDLNIDFSSLWHASQDRYQKQIFDSYFEYVSSMALASDLAHIDLNEGKLIAKYLQTSSTQFKRENKTENLNNLITVLPKELANKLQTAQNIQYTYLAFQSLLPGLSFISAYDLHGVVPLTSQKYTYLYPEFPLRRKQGNEENKQIIMLNSFLENQINNHNSLLNRLKNLYAFKQKEELYQARIISVLETSDSVFALLMQTPKEKYFILSLNSTNTTQNAQIKIDRNNFIVDKSSQIKTHFTWVHDVFKNVSKTIRSNTFSFSLNAYECSLFEVK